MYIFVPTQYKLCISNRLCIFILRKNSKMLGNKNVNFIDWTNKIYRINTTFEAAFVQQKLKQLEPDTNLVQRMLIGRRTFFFSLYNCFNPL